MGGRPVASPAAVSTQSTPAAHSASTTTASAAPLPTGTKVVAAPPLNQETLTASSANIGMVSGATYTSNGYITSLQSALNKS